MTLHMISQLLLLPLVTNLLLLAYLQPIIKHICSINSAGRVSPLQGGSRRFKSYIEHHTARQFSWLERLPVTQEVDGSSPFRVAITRLRIQISGIKHVKFILCDLNELHNRERRFLIVEYMLANLACKVSHRAATTIKQSSWIKDPPVKVAT